MTNPKDIILSQFSTSEFLMTKMTEDLDDKEFFAPSVPGANHAAWIVGHMAVSEDSMIASLTGKEKRHPEVYDLFRGGSMCFADASKYPSRKEIEELFRDCRAHAVASLKASDESKWNDPSPEGWPKDVFPTLGSIWALFGTHPYWHIGQLTVCRVALGKKRVLE